MTICQDIDMFAMYFYSICSKPLKSNHLSISPDKYIKCDVTFSKSCPEVANVALFWVLDDYKLMMNKSVSTTA